jgi:hypothetical protein
MRNPRTWPLLALALMFAASGCIFSPDDDGGDTPPPETSQYHKYTHPDSVALNYQEIYANMDIDEYREALVNPATDPDGDEFLFISTNLALSTYDTEITTTNNMFDGQPGWDEDAQQVAPPISSIQFVMTPLGTWENIPADHPNFGGITGQQRDFQLQAFFERRSDTHFIVGGTFRLFVKQVSDDNFRVLGIKDNTEAKSAAIAATDDAPVPVPSM